jgi:hypothetical protein
MIKILLIVLAGLVLPYNLFLGFGYSSEGAICGTLFLLGLLFVLYVAKQSGALNTLSCGAGKDDEETDDGRRLL